MSVELTAKEMQVLLRVSYGMSNGAIGAALGCAEDTVKTHMRRLTRKLGVVERAAAVRAGFELGVLKLSDEHPSEPPGMPVVVDWQALERDRQTAMRARPLGDRHIGACFAAQACPCRETSTWRFPEPSEASS